MSKKENVASSSSFCPVPCLVGCLRLNQVTSQTAVAMNATVTAAGFGINAGMHSLLVQVEPASACHQLVHVLLAHEPRLEIGMLNEDGAIGQIELHSLDAGHIDSAEARIDDWCEANTNGPLATVCNSLGLLTNLADAQVNLINRKRNSALLVAGDNLLQIITSPALAAFTMVQQLDVFNGAVKLIDIRFQGDHGRLYLSGDLEILERLHKEWTTQG